MNAVGRRQISIRFTPREPGYDEVEMYLWLSDILSAADHHLFQSLRLLPHICLLVVIFTRSPKPVQQYAATARILEEVDDQEYKGY